MQNQSVCLCKHSKLLKVCQAKFSLFLVKADIFLSRKVFQRNFHQESPTTKSQNNAEDAAPLRLLCVTMKSSVSSAGYVVLLSLLHFRYVGTRFVRKTNHQKIQARANEIAEQNLEVGYFITDAAGQRIEVCSDPLTSDDLNVLGGDNWRGARFGEVWKSFAEHEIALKLVF